MSKALGVHWKWLLTSSECAYVLRFVEFKHRDYGQEPWDLRQSGVYHQYAANSGSSVWLLISISSRAQARIDTYIEAIGNIQQFNPFEVHLLLLDTAIANWRPYLVHLTVAINEQARYPIHWIRIALT